MSSIRCRIALRIPILALYRETVQNKVLEMSSMTSTIRMIFVERLFLDFTGIHPFSCSGKNSMISSSSGGSVLWEIPEEIASAAALYSARKSMC